jgi:geranylgeranylglycerol-phosphate geranylgeranyltransferase
LQENAMDFLRELWALTRFEHALMLAIAVLIGEAIVLGGMPPLKAAILLSILVPVLSEAGSFALNDYLDIETDRINKKADRPLVKGTLTPEFALYLSVACIISSVILAYFINIPALAIALVFNALAILYNWKLKDLPLLGNIYIALTMGIPFVFGNYVVSPFLTPLAVALALLGFVSGLAREIIKSVQDMEGDRMARKSETLPMKIGARQSVIIACAFYVLFILLSLVPFTLGLRLNLISGPLVTAADAGILSIIYTLLASKDQAKALKSARNISLAALFIGLLGLLAAAI